MKKFLFLFFFFWFGLLTSYADTNTWIIVDSSISLSSRCFSVDNESYFACFDNTGLYNSIATFSLYNSSWEPIEWSYFWLWWSYGWSTWYSVDSVFDTNDYMYIYYSVWVSTWYSAWKNNWWYIKINKTMWISEKITDVNDYNSSIIWYKYSSDNFISKDLNIYFQWWIKQTLTSTWFFTTTYSSLPSLVYFYSYLQYHNDFSFTYYDKKNYFIYDWWRLEYNNNVEWYRFIKWNNSFSYSYYQSWSTSWVTWLYTWSINRSLNLSDFHLTYYTWWLVTSVISLYNKDTYRINNIPDLFTDNIWITFWNPIFNYFWNVSFYVNKNWYLTRNVSSYNNYDLNIWWITNTWSTNTWILDLSQFFPWLDCTSFLSSFSPTCWLKFWAEKVSSDTFVWYIIWHLTTYLQLFDFSLTTGDYTFNLNLPLWNNNLQPVSRTFIISQVLHNHDVFDYASNNDNKLVNYFILLIFLVLYFIFIYLFLLIFVKYFGLVLLKLITSIMSLFTFWLVSHDDIFSKWNLISLFFLSTFWLSFIALVDYLLNPILLLLWNTFVVYKNIIWHLLNLFFKFINTTPNLDFINVVNYISFCFSPLLFLLLTYALINKFLKFT